MTHVCISETSTNASLDKKDVEEYLPCNRIFLNFTREFKNPAKDRFNIAKVKELFKTLAERQDFQEMKVSGWLEKEEKEGDEECENEEIEEKLKQALESEYDEECTTPKGGGQRFAMSRDFWYRKLNTLKAQKLDEVALEALDIPPDAPKEPKCVKYINNAKIYSSQVPEKIEDINQQIEEFNKKFNGKTSGPKFKHKFSNVYDHQN